MIQAHETRRAHDEHRRRGQCEGVAGSGRQIERRLDGLSAVREELADLRDEIVMFAKCVDARPIRTPASVNNGAVSTRENLPPGMTTG